jgi:dihydrolipoamide dehydrogenase
VRTYKEQIMSRALPSSIAIIGAGPISIEFAYVLANYGVAVTVIESLKRVLPNEDVDVSKEIAKAYRNLGVTMLVGCGLERLGVATDARTGGIVINDVMETTVPGVYVVGATSPPS